jgi:Holliday junction resolvasome RuvABC DNA-binding subunit
MVNVDEGEDIFDKATEMLFSTIAEFSKMGIPFEMISDLMKQGAKAAHDIAQKQRTKTTPIEIARIRKKLSSGEERVKALPSIVQMLEKLASLGYTGEEIRLFLLLLLDTELTESADIRDVINELKASVQD